MDGYDADIDALARRLRMARAGLGETQEEVAEATGLSTTAISLWERGRRDPGILHLKRLALHYGVTLDWLMGIM